MNMPKVSIMIPTYNQEKYIRQSIVSALSQNYGNLEVIVSDDCSKDDTYKVAEVYLGDSRFKLFRNESNIGRVGNYRKMLYSYATGEWALNMDGDDYLIDKDFISASIEGIMQHQNIVLVAGGKLTMYSDGTKIMTAISSGDRVADGFEIFNNWHKTSLPHFGCLYKRDIAVDIGFYKEDIISSDWESILRLVLHGNVILLKRIAGVWRKHDANASNQLTDENITLNLQSITKPYNYAISRGYDSFLLRKWQRKMFFLLFYGNILALIENASLRNVVDVYMRSYKADKRVFPKLLINAILTVSVAIRFILGRKAFMVARKIYFFWNNSLTGK